MNSVAGIKEAAVTIITKTEFMMTPPMKWSKGVVGDSPVMVMPQLHATDKTLQSTALRTAASSAHFAGLFAPQRNRQKAMSIGGTISSARNGSIRKAS